MKKLLLGSFLFMGTVHAQVSGDVTQLNGSVVKADQLTKIVQHIIDTGHVTGLSVAVIHHDKMVYQHSFGIKNMNNRQPMDPQTIQYAASFTKPVFSYIFLQLVDKGIFELDKPIYLYLKKPINEYPKFQDLADQEDGFRKITSRMILSHSSGLPVLRYMYGDKLTLIADPGRKFYYSNEGMNLLGFIVEEYTGKTLETLAQELVFAPLGMTSTGMVWHKEFDQNFAMGHDSKDTVLGAQKRKEARAAGSMVTTTTDYAKFLIALQQKKGLSPALCNAMLTPQMKITSKRGFGPRRDSLTHQYDAIGLSWGLGIGLFISPYGKACFHTGHTEGWQNYWVSFPEKGITIILMSNSDNFELSAKAILKESIGDVYSPLEWLGYFDK